MKKTLTLKDFKLTKNRQRPDQCFEYKHYDADIKYQIFTMNGGQTLLASIEQLDGNGQYRVVNSSKLVTVDQCIEMFNAHRN